MSAYTGFVQFRMITDILSISKVVHYIVILAHFSVVTSSDPTQENSKPTEATTLDGTPLPPPVGNLRTTSGAATFENLLLPAPPPMYRPFLLIDEEKKKKSKGEKLAIQSY